MESHRGQATIVVALPPRFSDKLTETIGRTMVMLKMAINNHLTLFDDEMFVENLFLDYFNY